MKFKNLVRSGHVNNDLVTIKVIKILFTYKDLLTCNLLFPSLFQALGQWSARRKGDETKRGHDKTRGTGGKAGEPVGTVLKTSFRYTLWLVNFDSSHQHFEFTSITWQSQTRGATFDILQVRPARDLLYLQVWKTVHVFKISHFKYSSSKREEEI